MEGVRLCSLFVFVLLREFFIPEKFTMILRQFKPQSLANGTILERHVQKYIINNSVRTKSIFQWYKKFWEKFDETKIAPPYSHCTQAGDPVLRNKASEVPLERIKSDEIQKLIDQLKRVLHNFGLVGIAAPQIGVPYRVIVMEAPERLKEKYSAAIYSARQMDVLPLTTVINPILKVKNFNIKTFPEGCASVCGYTGDVKRYEEVMLSGFNESGDAINLHLKGCNARIAQHEVDHLNGQLFVDIMEKKSFSCATWQSVNTYPGKLSIPFYPPKKSLLKRKRWTIS